MKFLEASHQVSCRIVAIFCLFGWDETATMEDICQWGTLWRKAQNRFWFRDVVLDMDLPVLNSGVGMATECCPRILDVRHWWNAE